MLGHKTRSELKVKYIMVNMAVSKSGEVGGKNNVKSTIKMVRVVNQMI
jgi:hypothetical protein